MPPTIVIEPPCAMQVTCKDAATFCLGSVPLLCVNGVVFLTQGDVASLAKAH